MLFVFDDARDTRDALHHFRIGIAHVLGHETREFVEIGIDHARHATVAHGPPHDFAQHVAAAFVGRHDAVVNQERSGAGMIGIDAEDGIGCVFFAERTANEVPSLQHDGLYEIGVVVRKHALLDGGDAFETHAGVDRRARQRRKFAGFVAVVLHEHEIPYLNKTLRGVIGETSLPRLGAEIVMDFRARAAGAGVAHLPEVIFFVETEDAFLGYARDFLPQLFGFVVFAKNGDVEFVFIETVVLGDQLPGEGDGVAFEVIAEGEIPQHFEKRVVAAGVADVIEIVVLAAGADALLRGGGAGVIALFVAQKHIFKLVHPGVGEQQRGIVGGNQR